MCFDVSFNRETAGECAVYFSNATELVEKIDQIRLPIPHDRTARRTIFTRAHIADQYLVAMLE
jgi:hypothetical protein